MPGGSQHVERQQKRKAEEIKSLSQNHDLKNMFKQMHESKWLIVFYVHYYQLKNLSKFHN